MKTTAVKFTMIRRDVPEILWLTRVSGNAQDVQRQNADAEWVETRYNVQIGEQLIIEGVSGKDTLKDADIQRILDKLRESRWAGLGISAIDRLVRPGEDDFIAYGIFQKFNIAHKPIYSRREGYIEPWTEQGHDACIDAARRARAERLEIRRRTMDEKIVLARRGINCAASAAYGYRFQKLHKREGTWVIFEDEAKVVRKIFELAARGLTGYRISKWLNKLGEFAEREGVPIPTRTGKQWQDSGVRQLMRNSCYIGEARFAHRSENAIVIPVPAILATPEQRGWWDAAQAQRATNRARRSGRPSPNYLLQHLIYCARCGKRLTGRRDHYGGRAYQCFTMNRATFQRLCSAPQIPCRKLDDAVYLAVLRNLANRATIERMIRAHHDAVNKSTGVGAATKERLARLQREEKHTKRIIEDPELDAMFEENKRKLLGIQAEIAVIERELKRAATVFTMPSPKAIDAVLELIERAKQWSNYQDRRGLIEHLVTRVQYADGAFQVEGRIAFSDPSENVSTTKQGLQNPKSCVDTYTGFVPFVFNGKVAA